LILTFKILKMNNDKSISMPLCLKFHIFSINARAWPHG
jgi:hypothetical protein